MPDADAHMPRLAKQLSNQAARLWVGRKAPGVPHLVSMLLLLLMGLEIMRIAGLAGPFAATEVSPAEGPAGFQPSAASSLVGGILAANLFGERASSDASVTEDQSGLVIKGILFSDHPEASIAIVSGTAFKEMIAMVGTVLPDGSTLREIGADSLILDRNGVLGRVQLVRAASTSSESGGSPDLVNQESVAAAQDTQATAEALGAMGVRVAMDDQGEVAGLQGSATASWRAAGLTDTDIIVAIDDVPVSSLISTPNAIARAASSLAQSRISVMRNGKLLALQVGSSEPTT